MPGFRPFSPIRPPSPSPRRAGFTLVEMLVAALVLAVLAGIAMTVTGRVMEAAEKARVTRQLHQLSDLLEAHWRETGAYPTNETDDTATPGRREDLAVPRAFVAWATNAHGVTRFPVSPLDGDGYSIDPWDGVFYYRNATNRVYGYVIGSTGPDQRFGDGGTDPADFGGGDDLSNRHGELEL